MSDPDLPVSRRSSDRIYFDANGFTITITPKNDNNYYIDNAKIIAFSTANNTFTNADGKETPSVANLKLEVNINNEVSGQGNSLSFNAITSISNDYNSPDGEAGLKYWSEKNYDETEVDSVYTIAWCINKNDGSYVQDRTDLNITSYSGNETGGTAVAETTKSYSDFDLTISANLTIDLYPSFPASSPTIVYATESAKTNSDETYKIEWDTSTGPNCSDENATFDFDLKGGLTWSQSDGFRTDIDPTDVNIRIEGQDTEWVGEQLTASINAGRIYLPYNLNRQYCSVTVSSSALGSSYAAAEPETFVDNISVGSAEAATESENKDKSNEQINVIYKKPLRLACNRPLGFTRVRGGFPMKSVNMNQGSYLSNSLLLFNNKAGNSQKPYPFTNYSVNLSTSSSQVTARRRINAIGKNTNRISVSDGMPSGFSNSDKSYVKTKLQRSRSAGCVAPKKKNASPISAISRVPANRGMKLP